MATHYKSELSPVANKEELERLLAAIAELSSENDTDGFAALSVTYDRKGYDEEADVTSTSPYRGYEDSFNLTVQVRVKSYMTPALAHIQPFIDEAIQSDKDEKEAAARAELEQVEARRAQLLKELEDLDA